VVVGIDYTKSGEWFDTLCLNSLDYTNVGGGSNSWVVLGGFVREFISQGCGMKINFNRCGAFGTLVKILLKTMKCTSKFKSSSPWVATLYFLGPWALARQLK